VHALQEADRNFPSPLFHCFKRGVGCFEEAFYAEIERLRFWFSTRGR